MAPAASQSRSEGLPPSIDFVPSTSGMEEAGFASGKN